MADSDDHYEVLGVRPDATEAEVKRAYRQLVRAYHPDVSVDELAGQERFVQIVAAYDALSDPIGRAFYDQKLAAERRRLEEERRREVLESFRRQTVQSTLSSAEIHFLRGELNEAIECCRRVVKHDPRNAEAFALLGDTYRRTGQFDEATTMYSYAVQYAPDEPLHQQKLEWAAAKLTESPEEKEELTAERSRERVGLFAVCAMASALFVLAFSVLYVRVHPDLTLLAGWLPPGPVLAAGAACGSLLGFAMVLLLWLRPFDDDFFGASSDSTGAYGSPIGLYVATSAVLSFYLAVTVYVVVSAIDDQISPSMLRAFGAVLFVVAALALADWQHQVRIFLFAGNSTLLAFFGGWALGSVGRRPW